MSIRVNIKGEMFTWAWERSGKPFHSIKKRFPKIEEWVTGTAAPTFKQLEAFAKATYVPAGYLFLPEKPEESIPIPDCRTMGNAYLNAPSADLLDTLYLCQQRQEWYRQYAALSHEKQVDFVGSASLSDSSEGIAKQIGAALKFDVKARRTIPRWEDALRQFIKLVDDSGIMVMVSGVVGSNNKRKLNPSEFRGFALADKMAPLVFINGKDSKAAQIFTLAHEIAHLWLGETALSDLSPVSNPVNKIEKWCNQVAAELLVPRGMIGDEVDTIDDLKTQLGRLAKVFKVSTLVIVRRLHDVGILDADSMWDLYHQELGRLQELAEGGGGDFYRTQPARLSKRFARAIIAHTLEGQNSFSEAMRLLGIKKISTFHDLSHKLGAAV